ncbi:DUF692 family multinuclear iron-containing protein, partial [Streptomyces sp. NPDC001027]|uniref:multinuclear nonheme iron-dependent oxidase n=1 Tax=Streptomyces sp. NPDC001027 TaxID=3154771 RepID=UPI00332F2021
GQFLYELADRTGVRLLIDVANLHTNHVNRGEKEAQRLGRVLRPKADGHQAHFYSVVARDTIDQDFAAHRQRFLAEQGYAYRIMDADELLAEG